MGLVVVPALFITALIFFTLLGAALIYPKSWWGKLLAVCIVLSPLVWLTWDIPVGYMRYKTACKTEAGFKVYTDSLSPAKRVRLVDTADYPENLLEQYLSIEQVEAKDSEFYFVRPTVYALYERNSEGKIKSTLMDKVAQTKAGYKIIKSGPSEADYDIEKEESLLPYRLSKKVYRLRNKNKHTVAEAISFTYVTTDPDRSFGWTTFDCGDYEIHSLLSLIANKK